jgi:hypothetical protein
MVAHGGSQNLEYMVEKVVYFCSVGKTMKAMFLILRRKAIDVNKAYS